MDAILLITDLHLNTKVEICILMNVIVSNLKYAGELREGNAKLVKRLEAETAAKKILGCSSTTSNRVLTTQLGMHPLKTSRDVRKLKSQYGVMGMPKKRLPAIADIASCMGEHIERASWRKVR